MGGGHSTSAKAQEPDTKQNAKQIPEPEPEPVRKPSREINPALVSRRFSLGSATRQIDDFAMPTVTEGAGAAFKGSFDVKQARNDAAQRRTRRQTSARLLRTRTSTFSVVSRKAMKTVVEAKAESAPGGQSSAEKRIVSGPKERRKSKTEFMKNFLLFGVVDGIGPNAQEVCKFVQEFISSELEIVNEDVTPGNVSTILEGILKKANAKLCDEASGVDISKSGAMATVVFYGDRHLVVSTLGECRCAWIVKAKDGVPEEALKADFSKNSMATSECEGSDGRQLFYLNPSHNWDSESEAARAIEAGCIIEKNSLDNVGSVGRTAVWTDSSHVGPGICTSRVMGFSSAKDCGVSCEPETKGYCTRDFTAHDVHAVLVGTSGFWTVVSPEDVLELARKSQPSARVVSFVDAQRLSTSLVAAATEKWEEQFADSDMQVQCFFPFMFESEGEISYQLKLQGRR